MDLEKEFKKDFIELKERLQGGISRRTSRRNSASRVLSEVHLQGHF